MLIFEFMQSASCFLMIRPACFFFNEETDKSNAFQNRLNFNTVDLTQQAQIEFDEFVAVLRQHDIQVIEVEDTLLPPKPDAVFPNNWISVHENGHVFTYPMESKNRRSERRLEVIQELSKYLPIKQLNDLAEYEGQNKFLEGTGSMVLDRVNKIVYAGLSPRTNLEVLEDFASQVNYEVINFKASDEQGKLIYHTNVMMSVGEQFAVVCLEAVRDINERKNLLKSLEESRKDLIEISLDQMNAFAGNILQVKSKTGESFIVLSATAFNAFNKNQLNALKKYGVLLPIDISVIEKVGGGSVRCMMAEVFQPKHLPKVEI